MVIGVQCFIKKLALYLFCCAGIEPRALCMLESILLRYSPNLLAWPLSLFYSLLYPLTLNDTCR
jgi:hypothetical protein